MPGGGAVSGRRAVFSTPLRRSNRAEKPRRSAKTVCASAKRRTMRCVSPHVSPQVVEKFCPLVWEMGKRTWACAGVACPALPCCPRRGAWRFWSPVDFAAVVPEGVACLLCRLPTMPSVYFFAPYPPSPLPRWGRGRPRLFHARGFAPCIPGVEPGRHRSRGRIARWWGGLLSLPPAYPAFSLFFCPLFPRPPSPVGKGETKVISCKGLCPLHPQGLNPRFAAKPTEFLYLERCRQPRRGGTGGEELRRLRWSSPPGQVEQMPHGERSPAPRRVAPEQGRIARWRRGLPRRFSFHALTGAAGCDILVYRTEPPRRTARKQKETPYRTAIPERRKGENRA